MEAKRIEMKGQSGHRLYQFPAKDKLTITPDSIAYVYTPGMPKFDVYQNRKWSYKTKNAKFAVLFTKLVDAFERISVLDELESKFDEVTFEEAKVECFYNTMELTISYEDGTRKTRKFVLPDDDFVNCYKIIKELIPKIEQIPRVLSDWECDDEEE